MRHDRRRPAPRDMSARRRRKSASTPEEQVARLIEIGERAYRAGIYASLEAGLEVASVSLVLHGTPDGAFSYRADMGNMFGEGGSPDEALDRLAAYAEGLAEDIRQGIRRPAHGWDYEDEDEDY